MMYSKENRFTKSIFVTIFDTPPAGDPPAGDPPAAGTFTPEQEAAIAQRIEDARQAEREASKETITQLEDMKNKFKLTQKEKLELETTISNVRRKSMTDSELANEEKARLARESSDLQTALTSERDAWKSKFESATITRSLVDAAATNDAVNPEQVVAMLNASTNLVEQTDDDGKGTGTFVSITDITIEGDDGTRKVLSLPTADAVKKMKSQPAYFNLFKGTGKPGSNLNNSANGKGSINMAELAKDPKAYREARRRGEV